MKFVTHFLPLCAVPSKIMFSSSHPLSVCDTFDAIKIPCIGSDLRNEGKKSKLCWPSQLTINPRLKAAETEAENSEMNIQRLNIRIDQIEDELIHEKLKIKKISDDVDGTFKQMESGVVVV